MAGIDTNQPRGTSSPAGGGLEGRDGTGAAPDGRRTAAVGGVAVQALEEAFERLLGPPAGGRLAHGPTAARLEWVLARLDRYANFGAGREGAGLELAVARLEALAEDGDRQPARHLGYLLPELEEQARRWKHRWAPQVKAARGGTAKQRAAARRDRMAKRRAARAASASPRRRRRA